MPRRRRPLAGLCAALSLGALPLSAAAQATLDLAGGFQPDPAVIDYQATGRDAAGALVRGCPGYAGSAPALVADLDGANTLLHMVLIGEGAAGFLAVGPDGIYRCETPDIYGITHARFERVMSGVYRVWPLAAAPGTTVGGTLLVSEIDLGPRDVVDVTGLKVDPVLLPPLLSEAPLDPDAAPAFGRLALPEAGVAEATVTLAGGVPADEAGLGCAGEINQTRPDVTVSLAAPESVLAIRAAAELDTTLVVVTPAGEAICSDDAIGYDPMVEIDDAAAGAYAVWVGTYPGGAGHAATLSVGRALPEGTGSALAEATLDTDAAPAAGRHALSGEGPLELTLSLAGGVEAGAAVPGCAGEIDPDRPDAVVTVTAREPTLWVHAAAEGVDTTLVVVGPDGTAHCNDDHGGMNPAIGFTPAEAGDYAVWVGVWTGGTGVPATLTVAREEPAGSMAGGELRDNPFIGRPIGSAAEAFRVLSDALSLGEVLSYDRLEETGPEGLVLHGVVLSDPEGAEPPVKIGRIRVSELDLASLTSTGAPERFAIAFEDIAYDALAEGARENMVPLPALAGSPPLSLSFSLLPPAGDATQRELRIDLALKDQLALGVAARMLWQDGITAMDEEAMLTLMGQSVAVELRDMGFVGAVLREVAAEGGQSVDALVDQALAAMAAGMGPAGADSPIGRVQQAVGARLHDLDRPGVLHLRLETARPTSMIDLLEALSADSVDESRFSLDIGYQPDK